MAFKTQLAFCAHRRANRAKFFAFIALAIFFSLGLRTNAFADVAGDTNHAATVLTIEGNVEIVRAGSTQPIAAKTNIALGFGDSLRTFVNSRATVRLSDLSVIRVNEKTILEIRPQADAKGSVLDLHNGSTYLFNRAKPASIQFHTPLISGAIRGTEFNLFAEDNGRTTLTLVDGEVSMGNDKGQLVLHGGEQGIANPGEAPRKTAVINAINIIQWSLYYPGVIDPDDLGLTPAEKATLANSLYEYRCGNVLAALLSYPVGRVPASDAEREFHAALLLAAGKVDETEMELRNHPNTPAARALRELIAAVKHQDFDDSKTPYTTGEWLAQSYYLQSHSKLNEALQAAKEAVAKSPNLGFAWVRLGELEFGLGHVEAAKKALQSGIELAPCNAQALTLKGFILAAQNRTPEAARSFDQAIFSDGALANAWLGRGLCKIRQGHWQAGRADLQVAATLEPNRSELRSYLGKAWNEMNDRKHAEKELSLAKKFDPNDPTPWLYSALLNFDYNRDNQAISDLEKSKELNDNRSVFRSRQLLDQDQAVRGANLAQIYRDDGMDQWSVREAAQAVDNDYANYSAHLFLSESYDALRDPQGINLRYETPWFSQLLVADLLAPVGSVALSQNVSLQEYSRMFEGDHVGAINQTIYSSHGDWFQDASQYANVGNTGFAVDEYYTAQHGYRPNNDLQQFEVTPKLKQQVTENDSLFFEADLDTLHSGDVRQYYDQSMASPTLRVTEDQGNIFFGYHRDWAPGVHTLFLGGRLDDRFSYDDIDSPTHLLRTTPGGLTVTGVNTLPMPFGFYSELVAYTAELQQIFQTEHHTLVFGARYQAGGLTNTSQLSDPYQLTFPTFAPTMYDEGIAPALKRVDGYGYYTFQPNKSLLLTAGVSYDHLSYSRNDEIAPVTPELEDKNQLSPKAGFWWMPLENTTFRGAYTESLGGVFYDSSVRLEPTEIAGFNQAFRSILPESVVGLVPGTRFETYDLAFDQKFPTRTYFTVIAEMLKSTGEQGQGYLWHSGPFATYTGQLDDRYDYRDKSLSFYLYQLVGDDFAFGASYQIDAAQLTDTVPFVSGGVLSTEFSPTANSTVHATLQSVHVFGLFNAPCGFYSRAELVWFAQSNAGYAVNLPGDDFAQGNLYFGYRLPRRHAEFQLGLLNINNRDYRLNPLNLYNELPRERTLIAEVKFAF